MRSRLGLAMLVGLGALWLAVPLAHADWKKDYDRGLKAAEAGRWAEAESAFRAALSEDGSANARKRFQGVVVKVYVPHYYAGLAAYRQGNCSSALEYWSNAGSAAVVAGQSALSSVQARGIADCNQKLAAASKPAPPLTPVASTPPATAPATTPSTRPPPTAVAIPPPIKPVATAPAAAPKPLPEPAKPPAPIGTPAPPALVAAVESFLAGRYAAVVQLDPATLADGRSRAQAFLLRAAARYTLAELADSDGKQLEQARQDVRAARVANSNLNPDETLFSPRFRAFWRLAR